MKHEPKRIRRGAVNRHKCVFIGGWFPKPLVDAMDRQVVVEDSDRSKLLRKAVSAKLGLPVFDAQEVAA